MSKLNLNNVDNSYPGATTINANSAAVVDEMENTLSRDGTAPNEMNANIDMNSNRILNLAPGVSSGEPVTVGQYLGDAVVEVPDMHEWLGWFNVKTYGAHGDGIHDDTDHVKQAIAAMGQTSPYRGTLWFPRGTYIISEQLDFTVYNNLHIKGEDAVIYFNPGGDEALFNFHNLEGQVNPPSGGIISYGKIENLTLTTSDTTRNKVFIRLSDACEFVIRDVTITGDGGYAIGFNTTGIETNGHESIWAENLSIYASIPIRIRKISNTYQSHPGWLSADHFNFTNVNLLAGDVTKAPLNNGGTIEHAVVYCDDSTHFSELKFTGSQAWVGGKYGFYCNWVNTAQTLESTGLVFENVRTEQIYDTSGYSIYMSGADGVGRLMNMTMNGCYFTGEANAVYVKNVDHVTFNYCYIPCSAGKYIINQYGLTNNVDFNSCTYGADQRSALMYFETYNGGGGNNGRCELSWASAQKLGSTSVYPSSMHFARKYEASVNYNRTSDVSIGSLQKIGYSALLRGSSTYPLPITSDANFNYVSGGWIDIFCYDGYDSQAYGRYYFSRNQNMTATVNGTSPYRGINKLNATAITGSATIGTAVAANEITVWSGAAGNGTSVNFTHNLNIATIGPSATITVSENVGGSGNPGFTTSTAGLFSTLQVGMWIESTGFGQANNNGKFLIIAVSGGTDIQVSKEGMSQGDALRSEAPPATARLYNVCPTMMEITFWRHEYNTGSEMPLPQGGI